jgi:hypothetical protein
MLLPLRSHKHAVQCFWFQTSVKCTRKWRKLLKSETDRFCRSILFIYIFYVKMLGSVDRKHTYYFFWLDITERKKFTWQYFTQYHSIIHNLKAVSFTKHGQMLNIETLYSFRKMWPSITSNSVEMSTMHCLLVTTWYF